METFTKAPRRLKLTLPLLTMAAVAAVFLAVVFTANPTWANTPGTGNTGNTGGYTNLSTYANPQPCGPGAGTAFMQEPHEITTGHYALFDVYWRTISNGGLDADGVGVLHTNLCPPSVTQTTTTEGTGRNKKTITTTTRSARNGGMDIEEAIIHVLDKHKATTVASNAGAGQMSLAEYPRVGEVVDAGDNVWWLRLDDPDTEDDPNTPEKENDETSDLGMGFSTLLLDDERWDSPMRYKFEVERHPADPTDVPHFFAYEAPKANGASQQPVWDSAKPGEGVMELDPDEYRALQWVFTKPGTYLLWVHLLGDVRQDNPHNPDDPDYDANWNPISSKTTETSEVYRYTIHVGSDLEEVEPPIFGVNLEVEENSPGGVKVGNPIPIYNADADVLYYDLTGPGHSNFELVASTEPHTVQVVVADGASLDYETKPSYDLNLSVTDRVDHEDNFNPYADDVLIVRIDLKDQEPGLKIQADRTSLDVDERVNFTAWFEPTPERQGQTPTAYLWAEKTGVVWDVLSPADAGPTWSHLLSSPLPTTTTTKTYRAGVEWANEDTLIPTFVNSNEITITWNP